jgi:hypothetical protein
MNSQPRNESMIGVTGIFSPHPNLSDGVNHNMAQSEIEGGVYLHELASDRALEIETENRYYTVINRGAGEVEICGHPIYCPAPVRVRIAGSNWGGSMLKTGFIGRGMHLEFCHPSYRTPIITSRIREIREIGCPLAN